MLTGMSLGLGLCSEKRRNPDFLSKNGAFLLLSLLVLILLKS